MTNIFNICPQELAFKDRFEEDIMAIFWSEYTSGTVFRMSYPGSISEDSIKAIKQGLKVAFSYDAKAHFANRGIDIKRREIKEIKTAHSFTWVDMINGQPGAQVSMIL